MTTRLVFANLDTPPPGGIEAVSRGCICERQSYDVRRWRIVKACRVHNGRRANDKYLTSIPVTQSR